jgi:hypothetical protein
VAATAAAVTEDRRKSRREEAEEEEEEEEEEPVAGLAAGVFGVCESIGAVLLKNAGKGVA